MIRDLTNTNKISKALFKTVKTISEIENEKTWGFFCFQFWFWVVEKKVKGVVFVSPKDWWWNICCVA